MSRLRTLLEASRYAVRHPAIKAALASFLLLILAAGVAFGYWWPANRQHSILMAAIDSQRRTAVEVMQAAHVTHAYRSAQSDVELLEWKLDAAGGQSDLVKSIERIAAKRGVRIVSQSYEEARPKGDYAVLILDIGLRVTYPALREFLADVDTLPVWIEVQEMNLERARDQDGLLKAGLRLLTYRKSVQRTLAPSP